ncbi:MAG TPA: thioesterase domain-containing protein, partial [Nannocystis sp.]
EDVLLALGQLWCAGVDVDWDAYYAGERRRRVPLPTYVFERVHHEHPVAAGRRGVVPGEPPRVKQAPAPEPTRAPAAASDPALQVLRELFASMLGVESARPDDHFFDLGGSSFMALRMRVQIEERLGVKLPVHTFVESPTLAGLADRVRSALAPAEGPVEAATRRLLVPLRSGRGGPELVMIQPIGGTVFTYRALARHLDPAYTITGVRASGMEPGEPVLATVEAIAARYLEELADRGAPPVLCGHSAGGVLAFEMARQLRARGGQAPLVVLLDTPPLSVARGLTLTSDEDTLQVAEMMRSEGSEAHAEFARALREDASFREIVRVTWQALAVHEPAPADLDVLYVQARASGPEGGDRAWMELCRGAFTRVSVDADHFTMLDEPTVATLARYIERAFEAGARSRR